MPRSPESTTEPGGARASIRSEFVAANGLCFEVDTCGDPESERLALLLHGFPEAAYSWRHQMPALAKLGYRCWAPNQRGYGQTSRPPGARSYSIDRLVEDVAALMDASGSRSVTLVGHDWGGIVAWFAALRRVRPIERLVVMNLPHPRRALDALRNRRQRLRSWYILFFQIPWLPEFLLTRRRAWMVGRAFRGMAIDESRFPDEVLDVYRSAALEPGAMTAMLNWYRGLRHSPGLRAEVEAMGVLDTPTLMVWGEVDDALGVELTYGTHALVKDLTLRYLPGVSHWVQQEAPEAVNEILVAWLTGQEVPGNRRSSEAVRLQLTEKGP